MTCKGEGCDTTLNHRNTSGFCRSCIIKQPHIQARRRAGLRQWADSGAASKVCSIAGKARWQSALTWCPPEYRAAYHLRVKTSRKTAAEVRAEMEPRIRNEMALRSGDLESAASWLRRYTICAPLGGGRYRYGSIELSPAEVIDRAAGCGWRPDTRWKVAA